MEKRIRSIRELDFKPRGPVRSSPEDWRDQFIYQLLIDRFDSRDENIPAFDPDKAQRGRDPDEGRRFQGGTLKGITRRLDYIKGLGCTAIWVTPPFKQRQDDTGSYHGYAAQDFLAIDPRFGTTVDLVELVKQAHARDMYVVVDIVVNHAGDVFRYKEDSTPYRGGEPYEFGAWHKNGGDVVQGDPGPDDAVWPVELQTPEAFKRKGAIQDLGKASADETVDGDFFSLKDLDTNNPAVVEALIAIYKHWIAAADIDGYRIDTVKHVEPQFLARFCNAIHEYALKIGKRNFILFGEIIGDDDLLHRYVGNNGPALGTEGWFPRLDAALDFPLYGMLDETIKGKGKCDDLRKRYEHFRQYYRDLCHASQYYVTFIDNHDQSHRPYRRFMHAEGDARVAVSGIGFVLTNLGIPCLYYGTEQGFDGGGDHDSFVREAMFGGKWGAFETTGVHFFNPEHPIYRGIAKVAAIRRDNPALRYGRVYFREIRYGGGEFAFPEGGQCTLAFSRILDTEEVLVVFNLSGSPREDDIVVGGRQLSPGTRMVDLMNGGEEHVVEKTDEGTAFVKLRLDAHAIAILGKAPQ